MCKALGIRVTWIFIDKRFALGFWNTNNSDLPAGRRVSRTDRDFLLRIVLRFWNAGKADLPTGRQVLRIDGDYSLRIALRFWNADNADKAD